MDVIGELRRRADRMAHDPLPAGWSAEPSLADVGSFGELVTRLRRLDHRSDEALRALARLADAGESEVCLLVTAALLPLLIVRCGRRPELVGEAVNELAARVVEPAHEPPAPAVANRMLRRVVWRVRYGRGEPAMAGTDAGPGRRRATRGPVTWIVVAVDRVALAEFRRRLDRPAGGRRGVGGTGRVGVAGPVVVDGADPAGDASPEVRRLATASLVA